MTSDQAVPVKKEGHLSVALSWEKKMKKKTHRRGSDGTATQSK
jgi:hypothetical protein